MFTVSNAVRKISKIIRAHYLIILNGLVLTLMVSAPLFIFPLFNRDVYQGINTANFGRDQLFYLSRGKDVLQGYHLGNAVLREGKEGQEMQVSYVEYVILAPLRWLGIADKVDIVAIYNVYNFIGVFILSLLIYTFAYQLSQNKVLATAAAVGVIAGYPILFYKTLFHPEALIYSRAFSPYLPAIPFYIFLNFLLKSLRTIASRYALFAGIALGALFYVYFFAWTMALAMCGVLLLVNVIQRNWVSAKKMSIIMGVGVMVGSYNIVRMMMFRNSEVGRQMFYFLWTIHTHTFVFSVVSFAALLLFGVYFYKHRTDAHRVLIFAIIMSGWIALNQQIITGQMVQQAHYYWYFITPLTIIVGLYMVWTLLVRFARWRAILFAGIIGVVYISAAVGQYRAELNAAPFKRIEQNFRPLLDFLNTDRAPGVILGNDEDTSYLYTVYTNHDVFWNSTAAVSFNTSLPRMKDALFVYVYLNKEARHDFVGFMNKLMEDTITASWYRDPYRAIEGYLSGLDFLEYNQKIGTRDPEILKQRDILLASMNAEYRELSKDSRNVENLLQSYGVNYIVWDKDKNPEWDLSFIRGLKKVFSYSNFEIYKIQ
ncbi:MAG: hypothetical protein A2754_03505 [Candidatus Magasanikbacteria bacterium RIFCSPHIGHO2_01_FULL_47_8]|uniref:Glycosyltransferase RgtA/B/C/D-like domain-containing protein n=1 Tax=Candidatus Magasanikbacteria bacterium RIFCSPHIGHO2_01_FULL_47_8 TaxID=1798673 RepID=A0A1F6MFF3_9BACT|nr:MAG: hypothetical protein A2754_03505 [Candidatus Magasanikbacteria bacterium RIFCSPHIGHO2_01_FULL_47_8]